MVAARHSWRSLAVALAILADLAPIGSLSELDRSVCCGVGGAVELDSTIAVKARCNLGGALISLRDPVARMRRAIWDLASLILVVSVWVHGVAPRLVLALVRVAAIVAGAKTELATSNTK